MKGTQRKNRKKKKFTFWNERTAAAALRCPSSNTSITEEQKQKLALVFSPPPPQCAVRAAADFISFSILHPPFSERGQGRPRAVLENQPKVCLHWDLPFAAKNTLYRASLSVIRSKRF